MDFTVTSRYNPIGLTEDCLYKAQKRNEEEWGSSHPSVMLVMSYVQDRGHPAFIASMLNHRLTCRDPKCQELFDRADQLERAKRVFQARFAEEGSDEPS